MELRTSENGGEGESSYNPRFLKFIKQFAAIGEDGGIFPKVCKNCGRIYHTYPEYIKATSPLGQPLEFYESMYSSPYSVQYRNCPCGSTLALAFTRENFPMIREFWSAVQEEAIQCGNSLAEVISRFCDECNRYMGIDAPPPKDPPPLPDESEVTE